MKICRITSIFPPPWEGLGPGPYELSIAQTESGHNLTVITKYSEGCEDLDEKTPFKIHRIKAKRDLVFSLLSAIKFFSLHFKKRYDVVHNHGASAIVLLLLKRLLFIKVPVVTSVHIIRKVQYRTLQKAETYKALNESLKKETMDVTPPVKTNIREFFLEKIYLKLSDSLAVVSESLKEDIKNEYGILNNVFVILNGVDIKKFNIKNQNKEDLRKKYSIDCKYLILFIGVFNGRKGEFDLIKAMETVVNKHNDTKLLMIGDGPTKKIAMKMVKRLNLEDNFKFISNVRYSEIQEYYLASDLFVLPSYSEGLPKVLLETMACGTPVIVSDIPAHKDIVKNNITGYLFKTGDTGDLSLTIMKTLENGEQRKKIVSTAKALVEKQYTWESVTKRLDHVYGKLENSCYHGES